MSMHSVRRHALLSLVIAGLAACGGTRPAPAPDAPSTIPTCWDCARNPIRELQLQVTPAPGQPKLDAPGGVLFVNWERANAR